MKWIRLIPILFLLAGGFPASGNSQEVTWTYRPGSEGWIGFWYNYSKASVEGREQTVVVVSEVAEDSPAEAYGIAVGDIITHLDGQPISEKLFSSMSESLEPGDLVRMVVSRDGRPREITVEAASPPAQVIVSPNTERMVVELESLTGNILRSMDSLRVSFGAVHLDESEGNVSIQVLRMPSDSSEDEGPLHFDFTLKQPFMEPLVFGPDAFILAPDMAVPFEAMFVESRATAPLKEELTDLRRELTVVRRAELARQRELAAALQGRPMEEILRQDERMKELQAKEVELLSAHEELSARLRDVSEAEMRRQWVEIQSRSEEAFFQTQKAQGEALARARWAEDQRADEARTQFEYTYRSPTIVGQSFFLGAQMTPLNPQLAEYFPVKEGVVVLEVVEGSPAWEAGLQGGDVIVTVAGEEVSSLSDLRFGLSAFQGPIQIRVIRKGEPVQIMIRR